MGGDEGTAVQNKMQQDLKLLVIILFYYFFFLNYTLINRFYFMSLTYKFTIASLSIHNFHRNSSKNARYFFILVLIIFLTPIPLNFSGYEQANGFVTRSYQSPGNN